MTFNNVRYLLWTVSYLTFPVSGAVFGAFGGILLALPNEHKIVFGPWWVLPTTPHVRLKWASSSPGERKETNFANPL